MSILVVNKVDGFQFYESMNKAMKTNKHSGYVDIYHPEDYDKIKTFLLINDGIAGLAITNEGNIISIFKDTNRKEFDHAMDSLMPLAIMYGGTHMNCYGDWLAKNYMKHGFIPIARCKFDETYASKYWDYEKYGRPDIYFHIESTNDLDTLVKNTSQFSDNDFYSRKELLPYMSYEEGIKYTSLLLKNKTLVRNNQNDERGFER